MLKRCCFILFWGIYLLATAQEYEYPYVFFTNSSMQGNYFFSSVHQSGASTIRMVNHRLPVSQTIFHTPGNALQLQYKNAAGGSWNAKVYRQEKRGMDHFKPSSLLSFWVYNTSASMNQLPVIQLLRADSTITNSVPIAPGTFNKWYRVMMPLSDFDKIDPSSPGNIIGVSFSQGAGQPGKLQTIYIDDIELLPADAVEAKRINDQPKLQSAIGYARHVDVSWVKPSNTEIRFVKIYRSEDGKNYKPVGVQQPYITRYADYTGQTGKQYFYKISWVNAGYGESELSKPVFGITREMSDEELLTMVQEASFRYYWEGAETRSGLAKENISGRHNMIASGASGFGIMALIAGTERGFISRDESVERFVQIVNFLEKAETFHGAFPHFIDGPSGKVEQFFGKRDNGADLVETSFLMQGLLAARQYFSRPSAKEQLIRETIDNIWKKVEWDWFRQFPDSKFLYWHWSPDQAWVINHNLIGWNETMITYLLAIASPTHAVPASMYYSGWANQDSTGQQYRSAWGQTKDGSMYSNGKTYFGIKLDVGVSNGGPLFFTHYSFLGYDPHAITDRYTNYFTNNQNIARINHRYCAKNPNRNKTYSDSAWGLTASDGPFNYSADEPVSWQDHGKIAPTGAISSFPYTPKESMKALKHYYYTQGKFLWGEFGFKDAYDLTNNWCSEIYMGLNQAPMTVMIENYRSGLIWKLFMSSPEVQEGLKKLQKETTKQP